MGRAPLPIEIPTHERSEETVYDSRLGKPDGDTGTMLKIWTMVRIHDAPSGFTSLARRDRLLHHILFASVPVGSWVGGRFVLGVLLTVVRPAEKGAAEGGERRGAGREEEEGDGGPTTSTEG